MLPTWFFARLQLFEQHSELSILLAQHITGTVWVAEMTVWVQVICEQHSNWYSWPVICPHPSHGKLSRSGFGTLWLLTLDPHSSSCPCKLLSYTSKYATVTVVTPGEGGRGNIMYMSSLCSYCLLGWCRGVPYCSVAILNVLAGHVILHYTSTKHASLSPDLSVLTRTSKKRCVTTLHLWHHLVLAELEYPDSGSQRRQGWLLSRGNCRQDQHPWGLWRTGRRHWWLGWQGRGKTGVSLHLQPLLSCMFNAHVARYE